jgi:hypothetical protein
MNLNKYGDIYYPADKRFRSWIVTGPPGSGKSYLMQSIGGWPEEICIDVEQKRWWAVEPLKHRPREIHFALPFEGIRESRSVYDERWKGMRKFPKVAVDRIRIPKARSFSLAPDWRARFVFDFILPPPEWVFQRRKERLSATHSPVDLGLTQEWVRWQVHVFWRVARYFHQSGLQVLVRPFNTARPFTFSALDQVRERTTWPTGQSLEMSTNWETVNNVHRWIDVAGPDDLDTRLVAQQPLLAGAQ